ncbi:carbon storage regulator [Photobacterium carnosum]|uniref:carbon storage regulator n=1 Tax=Photobacterium carnosum TaxID=2023717 RepID=UPI0039F6E5B2
MRYVNDRLTIGTGIVITILDIRGNQVRIGTPKEISVYRDEVFARMVSRNTGLNNKQKKGEHMLSFLLSTTH